MRSAYNLEAIPIDSLHVTYLDFLELGRHIRSKAPAAFPLDFEDIWGDLTQFE